MVILSPVSDKVGERRCYYFLLTCFFFFLWGWGGAPLAQLEKSRARTGLLIASSLVRISPGAQCCVLEQDTSPSLLSTGSTEMTEKLLTGTESLKNRQWLFVRYRTNSNLQYIGYSSGTGRLVSQAICPVPDE